MPTKGRSKCYHLGRRRRATENLNSGRNCKIIINVESLLSTWMRIAAGTISYFHTITGCNGWTMLMNSINSLTHRLVPSDTKMSQPKTFYPKKVDDSELQMCNVHTHVSLWVIVCYVAYGFACIWRSMKIKNEMKLGSIYCITHSCTGRRNAKKKQNKNEKKCKLSTEQ